MFLLLSRKYRHYYTYKYSHYHITAVLCTIILLIIIHKIDFSFKPNYEFTDPLIFNNNNERVVQQRKHERIDWNNYDLMYEDSNRRSKYGEHGKASKLRKKANITRVNEVIIKTGYNGLLSDKISLNRSIPDYRSDECTVQRYYADVPSASVIICFRDDHLSTVVRTVQSIINRTPEELLEEIILVDDGSSDGERI